MDDGRAEEEWMDDGEWGEGEEAEERGTRMRWGQRTLHLRLGTADATPDALGTAHATPDAV
jgi:hypothetical protein